MVTAVRVIHKVVNTSTKKPTPSQAQEILRNCGIMDSKYQVKSAYKPMITQSRKSDATK